MNCIFCHRPSDNSKSIEHIVPESLGNKTTVLWKGAVCDKCNNYFATKIEKELLNQPYFVSLRNRNFIKTKRNRSVFENGIVQLDNGKYASITFSLLEDDKACIDAGGRENNPIRLNGQIITPVIVEPDRNNYVLSRFLAKCAFEYLVFRTKEENFIAFSEYLRKEQFEPLRKYARYGEGCRLWPYYQRRIYGEGDMFVGFEGQKIYETLLEMDFLSIELERNTIEGIEHIVVELYYILVVMGIEYAIHIAEPDINGYELWLKNNSFKSPVERYGEIRTPNTNPQSFQITEELISRMKSERE